MHPARERRVFPTSFPFFTKGIPMQLRKLCTVAAAIAATLPIAALTTKAWGSSHREAPNITRYPTVDSTDFYLFNSYEPGRDGYVTLLANYIPLQDVQRHAVLDAAGEVVGLVLGVDALLAAAVTAVDLEHWRAADETCERDEFAGGNRRRHSAESYLTQQARPWMQA